MKRLYLTAAIVAILLVIFAITSCKTTKFVPPVVTDDVPTQEMIVKSDTICKPIVKDTAGLYGESDEFLLVGAKITGACLEIEVEYSGGCGGDEWTLAWNGTLMKSLPPKASIYLHLKDNDACREIVRKKVYFDVSTIYDGQTNLLLRNFRGDLTYMP